MPGCTPRSSLQLPWGTSRALMSRCASPRFPACPAAWSRWCATASRRCGTRARVRKCRRQRQRPLKIIERKLKLNATAETLFFGLSLGSVLVLAAIGLAITFGVMGVINMAHGELIMLGAYTTYLVQQAMPNAIEYSLFVAIPAAFLVSGAFGVAIERLVIRFLYGRPLETLLATFGISLILQQLVRTTISRRRTLPWRTPVG